MRASRILAITAALAASCSTVVVQAFAETVGKAVSIKTDVTGDKGALKRADPISRNERIRSNKFGLGHFEFVDGTKLVVGPNSNIVIDEYVLGEGNKFKKLAITATRGAFRWISGKSPSAAYRIATPAGALGVRGTAVDIAVRGDAALLVLLQGKGEWCNEVKGTKRRQCVTVSRPCDFIVARRGAGVTKPRRVSRNALNAAGDSTDALPFLVNNHRLLASYQLARYNCGMGRIAVGRNPGQDQPGRRNNSPAPAPAPAPPSEPPSPPTY